MEQIKENMAHFDERIKSNTEKINLLEKKMNDDISKIELRVQKSEILLQELDKAVSISMEQIKNIVEDLKQTSINFKEAQIRSNMANSKETEILKEKYLELDKKVEKVSVKLEQETVLKDANNWRASKKQIWSWILNIILVIITIALGLSRFL